MPARRKAGQSLGDLLKAAQESSESGEEASKE